jgi:hypothetical protein
MLLNVLVQIPMAMAMSAMDINNWFARFTVGALMGYQAGRVAIAYYRVRV